MLICVGIGLSAKFIEEGGGDLIIIYNSGRFRMAGRGSLAGLMPYSNANDVRIRTTPLSVLVEDAFADLPGRLWSTWQRYKAAHL